MADPFTLDEVAAAINEIPESIITGLTHGDQDELHFLATYAHRTIFYWRTLHGETGITATSMMQ